MHAGDLQLHAETVRRGVFDTVGTCSVDRYPQLRIELELTS